MSRCWVRFSDSNVPNRWNPTLVGKQFKPKRKRRHYGSVPIIRCVSSKQGLKCLRQNSLNKRWYSLSPGGIYDTTSSTKVPRSRKLNLVIGGRDSNLDNVGSFCRRECVGEIVPGMKTPTESDAHILQHMRCNCSACMNFACHWRSVLKNEFSRRVRDPLTPKRKLRRWTPIIGRCVSPDRARVFDRSPRVYDRFKSAPRRCRRSPQVSWWFGECAPATCSRDDLDTEKQIVEDVPCETCSPKNLPQDTESRPCSDGFTAVAMDGTIRPSRLRNRVDKQTWDEPLCEDFITTRPVRISPSIKGQSPMERNRLVQGILDDANTIGEPKIDKLEHLNYCKPTACSASRKFVDFTNESQNLSRSLRCQSLEENLPCRCSKSYHTYIPEWRCPQANISYCSNKTTNKCSLQKDGHRHDHKHKYHSVFDDKNSKSYDSVINNDGNRTSPNKENACICRCNYLRYNGETSRKLSLNGSHIPEPPLIKKDDALKQYSSHHEKLYEKRLHESKSHAISKNIKYFDAKSSFRGSSPRSQDFSNQFQRKSNYDSCKDQTYSHRHQDHHDGEWHRHLCREYCHGNSCGSDLINGETEEKDTKEMKRIVKPTRMSNRDDLNFGRGDDHDSVSLNKNIDDRLTVKDTLKTHAHADPENTRRAAGLPSAEVKKYKQCNTHETRHEQRVVSDTSVKLKEADKTRLPSKLYNQWTSISPDKYQTDNCHRSCGRPMGSCMGFNENRKCKRLTSSPDVKDFRSRYLSTKQASVHDKHSLRTDSRCHKQKSARHSQSSHSSKMSSLDGSTQDYPNRIHEDYIEDTSLLFSDHESFKTKKDSRKSRPRSRREGVTTNNAACNLRKMSDMMQSNSFRSPTCQRNDAHPFRPSERAMRDSPPKTAPEWLTRHLSLMSECSNERQKNAKSRMKRIVEKAHALHRSKEHMHMDLDDMNARLDKVKDTQQRYFQRVNEAIQRIQDRNNACSHSQAELTDCVRGINQAIRNDNSQSETCIKQDIFDHAFSTRVFKDTTKCYHTADEKKQATGHSLRHELSVEDVVSPSSYLNHRLRPAQKYSQNVSRQISYLSDLRSP